MEPASFYENLPASELLKLATTCKHNGDIDGAIRCLRFFKKKPREETSGIPISSHVRLPLYLQEAGFFDDAVKEFNELLNDVDAFVDEVFNHQPPKIRKMLGHARYYVIYDKMRLAFEREQKTDEAHKYRNLYAKHKKAHTNAIQVESSENNSWDVKNTRPRIINDKTVVRTNAKHSNPAPATKEVRVVVRHSTKEIIETIFGLFIILIVIWGVIHFLF